MPQDQQSTGRVFLRHQCICQNAFAIHHAWRRRAERPNEARQSLAQGAIAVPRRLRMQWQARVAVGHVSCAGFQGCSERAHGDAMGVGVSVRGVP